MGGMEGGRTLRMTQSMLLRRYPPTPSRSSASVSGTAAVMPTSAGVKTKWQIHSRRAVTLARLRRELTELGAYTALIQQTTNLRSSDAGRSR